ncbi:hypothetical protein KZ327_10775, partial [Glaesserella parasuis]|nr:hypothetical protein [Glaesserella parasuis]
ERFQRPLHYALVDEVDSILIDEARTPLIISGPAEDATQIYQAELLHHSHVKLYLKHHQHLLRVE